MRRAVRRRKAQRGVALILLVTVLVLGVAWFIVGALGKAAPTTAERETRTGQALRAAKNALLAYTAQYAARTDFDVPGRLPCPELLNVIGTASEGQAASSCSNSTIEFGRLPWKTLGIDQIRDGDGEPLWYVLSPGFRTAPVNFGSAPGLSIDGTPAVALIVAPGRPVNTQSEPGTPPAGCSKVSQQSNRYATPLNPANFFECGNTVTGSFLTVGTSPWSNDRAIAITAADWIDAIAGSVADRVQRQVAPALNDWYTTESLSNWGTSFLPYASSFDSKPSDNDLCGNFGQGEGLMPTASSPTCDTRWSGNMSLVLGLLPFACTQQAAALQCSLLQSFGSPPFSARITATAQNVASSFRRPITISDIAVSNGGTATLNSISLSPATGAVTTVIDVTWPVTLGLFTVTVDVAYLPSATILSDSRMTWFIDNDWARYTYYAVSQGARIGAASTCSGVGDPDCLTVNGLPNSSGNANDKKFVLTLMGRALAALGQSQPSPNVSDYLESHAVGSAIHTAATVTGTFNDRIATCPFQYVPATGGPIAVCN